LRWTRQAIDLANAAGDSDFAAYGLVRHALMTLYRGDAAQTRSLPSALRQALCRREFAV
jgi:hypothetical protein